MEPPKKITKTGIILACIFWFFALYGMLSIFAKIVLWVN